MCIADKSLNCDLLIQIILCWIVPWNSGVLLSAFPPSLQDDIVGLVWKDHISTANIYLPQGTRLVPSPREDIHLDSGPSWAPPTLHNTPPTWLLPGFPLHISIYPHPPTSSWTSHRIGANLPQDQLGRFLGYPRSRLEHVADYFGCLQAIAWQVTATDQVLESADSYPDFSYPLYPVLGGYYSTVIPPRSLSA